jgi:outer membrane protein assembly factor BamB
MNDVHTSPAVKSRPLLLPLWLWVVLVLMVALGVGLQLTQILGEPAFANMACMVLTMLAGLVVLVWFLFLSGFPWLARLAGVGGLVLAAVVFFSVFEIRGFFGNMLLDIVPRHGGAAQVPTASGDTVDLLTTTPQDFWQFLGPNRNATLDNIKLGRDWGSKPPKLLWKKDAWNDDAFGEGWSGFAVVNGFAVTLEQYGDQEAVTCYEVKTGKLRWVYSHPARYDTLIAGTGPRSTPTIHQGKVYALGAMGILVCLDGADGKILWKKDLLEEFGISRDDEERNLMFGRSNSPLIVHDLVVVPAGGSRPPTKEDPGNCVSLVAYDKNTGKEVWRGGNRHVSYSSPTLATLHGVEQILSVNENYASGHDPKTGKVLWEFEWPGISSKDANCSQAVPVGNNRVFISKGYEHGAALYEFTPNGDGTFQAKPVWHNKKSLFTKFTNVAIRNGYVYGLSNGILECVELETGKRMWKGGHYGHGQLLGVGDLLLIISEHPGSVFLVEASATHKNNVLGQLDALEGKTWNNIALYGPYLLVRNAKQAACYELPLEE